MKQEFRDQGHYLTGALERSIRSQVKGTALEGTALGCAQTLNDGIPADQIRIDSQALREMTRYVELRMG